MVDIVKFLLIFLFHFQFSRGKQTLPTGCTVSGRTVSCSSAGLKNVPQFPLDLRDNTTTLVLKNNDMSELLFLQTFRYLTVLDASSSNIREVSNTIDVDLPRLKLLILEHNKITSISSFKNLREIKTIRLKNNSIDTLEQMIFLDRLIEFDLSNNKIVSLNPINVWHVDALTIFKAANNRLTDLFGVKFPKNLVYLDLSNNRLYNFEAVLPKVQWLLLKNNNFKSLKFLTSNDTRMVWRIDLDGNEFKCNCDLYKEKMAIGRKGVVFGDNPYCTYANGRNESLIDLSVSTCPATSSKICAEQNALHYSVNGMQLHWTIMPEFTGTNISWTVTDVSGNQRTAGSSSLLEGKTTLSNLTSGVHQLCLTLSQNGLACLYGCQLLPPESSAVWASMEVKILIGVSGFFLLVLLVVVVTFAVVRGCNCCETSTLGTNQMYASAHSLTAVGQQITGIPSNFDAKVADDGTIALRPLTTPNGFQSLPSRRFTRNQVQSSRPQTLGRNSVFRSERHLPGVGIPMTNIPASQSVSHLHLLSRSRPSLASRELPETPEEHYAEMSPPYESQEGTGYEYMRNQRKDSNTYPHHESNSYGNSYFGSYSLQ